MSTGLVNLNQTQAAIKKLFGKAHTSILNGLLNEGIPSGIPIAVSKVFGQEIPNSPGTSPQPYDIVNNSKGEPVLERVVLTLTSVSGTSYDADSLTNSALGTAGGATSNTNTFLQGGTGTSTSGPHAYRASLPSTYESNSSNPKRGTGVFVDGQDLANSLGLLQTVNESFSTALINPYEPVVKAGTTLISNTDAIDYLFDSFAGILFVQDYNASKEPTTVEAWIYIGDMADVALKSDATGTFISSGSVSASTNVGDIDIFKITSESKDLVTLSTNGGEVNFNVDGNLVANKYVVSSSITFMTTSFSEGNTAFGDSLLDTHQFTGSLTFTGSATYATMSNATYSEIAYQDSRGGLKFSHIIDGGSF